MGMGVFTGIFRSATLLISSICLPVADVPVSIPLTSSAFGQIGATPYSPITFYFINPSLLTSEYG